MSTGLFDPEVLKGDAKTFAVAYETFKVDNRYLDFQDMLLYAADLLERRPDIRQKYRDRFDFIQIDEFQDISESDFRFLRELGENLFAVGDDDQTIYSFRTGAGELMQDFAKESKLYEVTENFRSRPEIVDAARQIIEGSRERLPKDLRSTRDPGGAVRYQETTPATLQSALEKELVPDADTAILTRTNDEKAAILNMLEQMPELKGRVSTVSTMHGSKGLEFDRVIMLLNTIESEWGGLIRSFPSVHSQDPLEAMRELEEERRLFYVGMTRAKEELIFMGRESKFLGELGFGPEPPPVTPTPQEVDTVNQETVEVSRTFRQRMERGFHEFRARYQKLRTYQDMVDMERLGDIPDGEIIENLSFAQVHREKIEELGRDLGIESASRRDRPTRLRGMDRFLANIHRPGKIQIAGYGGLIGADISGVTAGFGLIPRTVLGLGTAAATRGFRAADEFLYPHVRRPGQQLDYRELHHPLPPEVLANLPDDIDPSDFRLIEPQLDDYRPQLYEFAHPTEGFGGDAFERPLFFEASFQMERLRSLEEMEALRDEGLLTERHTYLDTRAAGPSLRITPYDAQAQDRLYRPPIEPRPARELSAAALEYMQNMREFLEEQRTSERRPSWLRRPDRRFGWERQHRRLLRPRIGIGVEQFLQENRGRDVVDFEQLHRVLTRLNPENTRLAMGLPFGGQDMAAETIGLHTEVLNLLERTQDPASPYFGSPTDIMAGGRLHQLPDGREGTADPDGIPRVDTPRFTLGQRARELFRRDRFRSPLRRFQPGDSLERAGLMVQTYDELGQKIRPGSGVYLGRGRVATALHTQLPMEYEEGMRTPVRATVQSVRGGEEIDVTGFLDFDEQLDLAILNLDQTNEAIKELESVRLGRGVRRGRGLRTMGAGQFVEPGSPELGLLSPELAAEQTRIRMPFSTAGTRGSVGKGIGRFAGDVFPVQSGSGVFSRGFLGRDRLQGIIGGRSADREGFFYPAQMVRRLLRRRGGVGAYQDVVSQFTPDTEGVITEGVRGRLDPLISIDAPREVRMGVREQTRQAYQMLSARQEYLGEYAPEISDLETRIYDIQGAGIPDPEGLEEIAQAEARLSEIRRPLVERIDPQIRQVLGADAPRDLADVDPSVYSRSYQAGQRLQGSRLGRGAMRVFDALGTGAKVVGKVGGIAGKTIGKAVPLLELLDIADKIDYFGGFAAKRITEDVVAGGDKDEVIERYRMLAESRAFHTGAGLDVVGRLLGTGQTEIEADYFEREGGLRDIGSLWSGLEWAERLPVLDPIAMAWDTVEKGAGGRLFQAYSDPTGRFAREDIDEQMEQIGAALKEAAPTFNRQQRAAMVFALEKQEEALTKELGTIPEFDRERVGQRRGKLEAELERVRAMSGGNIRYFAPGLGQYQTFTGEVSRSRAGVIKELEGKLAELPDARIESIQSRLGSVREQIGLVTGEAVAPTLPFTGAVTPLTEPLYGEALKEERARRMREPVVAPIFPTLPGQLRDVPTLSVAPLTEALTGEALESERARRMGFIPAEKQAIAETGETDTAPARRALGETDQGQWRYRFPELRVPADGQSYFRGEGQLTYRYPPIGVEGERRAVAPVIPTAPSTAPSTAPLTAPLAVPDTLPDTSMGLFRGMEQTDLNKQAYIILKDLESGVIDGDTLKGMLHAPRLGVLGQEEYIRYLGFDSAEKNPTGMQRYKYNRKFRTESAVVTEERRAREATQMHKEFLEQFKVGDEYHIPLEMDEFQQRGKYGRVLANPVGAWDGYFNKAIEEGVARVYGSSAFLGGESTLYERKYTDAEKEKAKRHYGRVDEDILKSAREGIAGDILAPALDMRSRFEGMGETYTQLGLVGTGVDDDYGIVGEAYTGRAQSQTNLEAYQARIQTQQILLDTERDRLLRGDALEPSVEQSNRIKALEEAIRIAEEGVQAEERAIKEYQRVIDQSGKLVQNLRKELLQSKIAMLKDERQLAVAGVREETTAIQEQVKEQAGFRKGFGKEVLGDVGFMTRFETDHRTGLIGEQGLVTGSLTGVRAEIEAQQGVVGTARTAWQDAFAAFELAPGKESGDALTLAEDTYNAEKGNLQQLKAMEQLYSRKLTILEAGIQTSEAASTASKRIAEQLEVEARMYEVRESGQALTETFKGIGEEQTELKKGGAFSLRDVMYLDPESGIDSGVKDWVFGSRTDLGEQLQDITPRLLETQGDLATDESELKDLREQLTGEMGKEAGVRDDALIGKLSAEIENKQKVVDNQKKIVEDYTKQVEAINKQLEAVQTQLDAHETAIGKQLQLQKEREEGFRIEGEKEQIQELLKTPYEQYTPEQQELFQRVMTQEGTDYAPEHVKGFKEAFTAVQEARVTSPHKMGAAYDALTYEQLMTQYDTDTGEFTGLSKEQRKMAKDRLMEVATPEQLIGLHDEQQAAFKASPEGQLKQTLKDRQEAERERQRLQREAERDAKRRQQYAERLQLREDTKHIDMLSKPLVQIPGRFVQAFDRRGQLDRTGREKLSDLRESVGEQKRDVMEDANLTIRQRSQQLERIEKESAKRRIQIEKDIAEAKKKAFSDVLDSFKNMFRDMLIRETEYMAQSQIREWWLGRQGWEQDGYGGYQRATPGGGGSLPIAVNIPLGDQSVRSDSGRTFVGSPTGYSGGNVSQQPLYYQPSGGVAPTLTTRPEGDNRYYAPDGRIFSDQDSYERQMKLESGDRGTGFDIAANVATLGIHSLAEEHLWSRFDDEETGERPWYASVGQQVGDITAGWAAKKYVLGPAYDAAKGLWSGGEAVATAGGEVLGPTLGDATSLLDVAEPVSSGFSQVSDFGPIKEAMSGVDAVSGLPSELTEVADVNFEPVTQGISDATKRGIEEGMSQVDGDPLMKVVENSGKEGAQGFWQGLLENPAVEVGGDALTYHAVMKQLTKPLQDFDSVEAREGKETNPYNILWDEILGESWGEFGDKAWQGVKNVGGFGKELGGGMWDFAKDIGGFVADIPGTLNRTSGTGNWFTQTGKDIGGFFGDTFGKDSWRSVTDLFAGMGDWFSFDHPVNDDIARRASARYVQRQAMTAAEKMGHSSAMDLLEEHASGFENEVENMQRMEGARYGGGGGGEMVAAFDVHIYQDENGREKLKQTERKVVRLKKQNVIERE